VLSLTPLSKCYSQTDDSLYCLPIGKARQLVSVALKARLADSLLSYADSRIALLESEKLSSYQSFTNLLKIEREKLQLQKEITAHTESVSNTYQEEKKSLKKQVRRLKWQRIGLGLISVVVIVVSL
jgi:hypothetical protein